MPPGSAYFSHINKSIGKYSTITNGACLNNERQYRLETGDAAGYRMAESGHE